MKFSILIPAYNTSKYIRRCLNSLINQTFQDFEIIVIDDGSKDDTLPILKEFQNKDKRVNVFHQENHGVAYTRNRLLDYAKGEWIAFVDSDDYVNKEYLYYFSKEIKEKSSSLIMVMCNHFVITKEGIKKGIRQSIDSTYIYEDLLEKKYNKVPSALWGKIIKRKHIDDNGIRFSDNFQMGEDLYFLIKTLYNVSTISYIDKSLYYWDKTNENSMTSGSRVYHYDNIKCYNSIIEFIKLKKNDNTYDRSLNIGKMFLRHSDYLFKKRNHIQQNFVYDDVVYTGLSTISKIRLFCINNDLFNILRIINRLTSNIQ